MKKLLTLLFSLMLSFNSYGEWTPIYTDDEETVYVDLKTIKKNNEFIYWWTMFEDGGKSAKAYLQGDCGITRLKNLTIISYSQPMGKGEADTRAFDNPEWSYQPPDSVFGFLLDTSCRLVEASAKEQQEIIEEIQSKEELQRLLEIEEAIAKANVKAKEDLAKELGSNLLELESNLLELEKLVQEEKQKLNELSELKTEFEKDGLLLSLLELKDTKEKADEAAEQKRIAEAAADEAEARAQVAATQTDLSEAKAKKAEKLAKEAAEKKKIAEAKAKEAEEKAKEAAEKIKIAEAKAKEAKEKAEVAAKKKELAEKQAKLAQDLTLVELKLKNQLEAEIAAQKQAYEREQYNQLLNQEIQEEQSSELMKIINNQEIILRNAWVNNIAAEVKSVWNFSGAEGDWFVEVLVTQNKEGEVMNVTIGDNNVGNSVTAKRFKDSVERAVYKSSPLPIAPDVSVWHKNILFTFYAD